MITIQKNTKEECKGLSGVRHSGKSIRWQLNSFMVLNTIFPGQMNILVFAQRMKQTGYLKLKGRAWENDLLLQ